MGCDPLSLLLFPLPGEAPPAQVFFVPSWHTKADATTPCCKERARRAVPAPGAARREEMEMSGHPRRRWTAAAALVATLALPVVPAAAGEPHARRDVLESGRRAEAAARLLESFWTWLTRAWAAEGWAVDPNGSSAEGDEGLAVDPDGSSAEDDRGWAVDPDG